MPLYIRNKLIPPLLSDKNIFPVTFKNKKGPGIPLDVHEVWVVAGPGGGEGGVVGPQQQPRHQAVLHPQAVGLHALHPPIKNKWKLHPPCRPLLCLTEAKNCIRSHYNSYLCTYDLYGPAYVMFLMREDPLRGGQVGGGWALEIKTMPFHRAQKNQTRWEFCETSTRIGIRILTPN